MTDNNINTPTVGVHSHPPVDTFKLWNRAKEELALQMGKATYNTWLRDTKMLPGVNGHDLVVAVRNEYALQWLDGRLRETIERTVRHVAERPDLVVSFVVVDENGESQSPADYKEIAVKKENLTRFGGFSHPDQNWTQFPDDFRYVLTHAHGSVAKLVGLTIFNTLGVFEDKKHYIRRQEWATTFDIVRNVCNISSKTTMYTTLWDAREQGYLILRPITDPGELDALTQKHGYTPEFALRLRHPDDPIDTPSEPRPGYGAKRSGSKRKEREAKKPA